MLYDFSNVCDQEYHGSSSSSFDCGSELTLERANAHMAITAKNITELNMGCQWLATINYKPNPYCLLLARSTNITNLTGIVYVWFDLRTTALTHGAWLLWLARFSYHEYNSILSLFTRTITRVD